MYGLAFRNERLTSPSERAAALTTTIGLHGLRETLWRLLVAFLIGAFALFASSSPVLAGLRRRLPAERGEDRTTAREGPHRDV
jgi:hypothetical protein